MCTSAVTSEGKYLKALMKDKLDKEIDTFTLYCDSQRSIALTKNSIHHGRMERIVKYFIT